LNSFVYDWLCPRFQARSLVEEVVVVVLPGGAWLIAEARVKTPPRRI
jgi:hypothetical protein